MAGTMVRQTMFTAGEVDAINFKRTDVADIYMTAAQSLLNCVVGTTGLAKKRSGTKFVLDVTEYASPVSKLYDFVDKNDNHYIVMTADEKAHIFYTPTDQTQVITADGDLVITEDFSYVAIEDDTTTFVQSVDIPYNSGDLESVDYTQDNDSIVFANPDYKPLRLYIDNYETLHFAKEDLNIYPYPAFDFNKINYNDYPAVFTYNAVANTFSLKLTGANTHQFNDAWIGGIIIGLGAGTTELSSLGYGTITAVDITVPNEVTFHGVVVVKFAEVAQMPTVGKEYSIRQPAWSDPKAATGSKLGFPAKVLYYQNRLWFASTFTLPASIFGSKINAPTNFDVGVGRDTDAIVYTIGQTDIGRITWLNGGKQLEVFTENYEFACPQDPNSGLTPRTFSIRQQSSYGSSDFLKPITYINNSYYVAKTGKAFINYNFTGVGLAYRASNISAISSHLIKQPSNRALIRGTSSNQDNYIHLLNNDNTLTTFQFATEYKFAALTPAVFQDDIDVIDIVSSDNIVYLLKRYVKTNKYVLEKMDDSTKLDSSMVAHMDEDGIISGLDIFNGYEVQVTYLGQDYGIEIVEDGSITVSNPKRISDTVLVGLRYDVKIKPMYIFGGQNNAPFKKSINQIYVDYYESLDFKINGKLVPYQTFSDIQNNIPLSPKTDTAIVDIVHGWERFDTIEITQSSPFDLQILSIGYMVSAAVI